MRDAVYDVGDLVVFKKLKVVRVLDPRNYHLLVNGEEATLPPLQEVGVLGSGLGGSAVSCQVELKGGGSS